MWGVDVNARGIEDRSSDVTVDRACHAVVVGVSGFKASFMSLSVCLNSGIVMALAPTWAMEQPYLQRAVIWKFTHKGTASGFSFFLGSLWSVNLGQRFARGPGREIELGSRRQLGRSMLGDCHR